MADEILIKYKVDTTELGKASVAVQDVTNETKELQTQIKATFADKSIEAATKHLYEQGNVMGALINEYGNATSALKAMEKELATMAALGQRNTKEFTELAKVTAHLKDTIGDTRNEIKKMSSDTKVFDTMVQGARGVAAAFSVATGLAAALGDENKDLQKTLLKVQGAMAALQGVQELANIATEEGGIATKAYGVALTVVDKISKVTGLSMAASWALATAGLTLAIAGVVALISYLGSAAEKSKELEEQEAKRKKQFSEGFTQQLKAIDDLDARQENELKRKQLEKVSEEELFKFQKKQQVERLGLIGQLTLEAKYNHETNAIDDKTFAEISTALEKERLNTLLNLRKEHKKKVKELSREKDTPTENLASFELPDAPPKDKVKQLLEGVQAEINIQKVPEVKIDIKAQPLQMQMTFRDTINAVQEFAGLFQQVSGEILTAETEEVKRNANEQYVAISQAHDKAVMSAHGNKDKLKRADEKYAKEKEKIDKKLAYEEAKIKREQAIINKITAAFNVGINIAEAVSKYTGGLPGTAVLMAIAVAIGAAQLAVIAATPLPPLPKYEKGGAVVLAGGRMEDGHLFGKSHREGGMLINAQGGEYIWDIPTVQKHGDLIKAAHENRIEDLMLHKYVVPMLRAREPKRSSDSESYDDWKLRATLKEGQRIDSRNARYIVNGISQNLSDVIRNNNRYR